MEHLRKSLALACVLTATLALCAVLPAAASTPHLHPATATYAWGSKSTKPHLLDGVTGEVGIDAGNYGVMAINADGTVEGWGQSWAPRGVYQMPTLRHVVQLADGNDDYAALEAPTGITRGTCPTDTSVWTVGLNLGSDLGLGDGAHDTYTTPQRVTTLDGLGVVQIVAASGHMLALTCKGDVYIWGGNAEGSLAMPINKKDFAKPTINPVLSRLTGGTSVGVELTTGSFFADLLVHGQAYGWGNNRLGQCGCGSTAPMVDSPTPLLQHGVKFTWIDGGGDLTTDGHTLALDAHGHAFCWGDNQQGQCGQGTTGIVREPTEVPGLPTLVDPRAGGQYSMFLSATGTVWTCGDNATGQVGDGTTVNQLTPVSVLNGMTLLSAGAKHDVAAN